LVEQCKYSEAIAPLVTSLEYVANDHVTLNVLAFALLTLDHAHFAAECAQRALQIRPDYEKAKRVAALADVAIQLASSKEKAQSLWGPGRIASLFVNDEARATVYDGLAALGSVSGVGFPERSAAAVRGIAAGVEHEWRTFLDTGVLRRVRSESSRSGIGAGKLTLGRIAALLAPSARDILSGTVQKFPRHSPRARTVTKDMYHLQDEDLDTIASCLVTLATFRNAAAHGESVTPLAGRYTERLGRILLYSLLRARLNRIFGYSMRFTWRLQNIDQISVQSIRA
jgi:hypothetical protein